jgi:hypothetical protein
MKVYSCLLVFLLVLVALSLPAPANADASHARIVRLSLVQGDVRFAREFHDDPMSDTKVIWEVAPLNLPVRQGYALATENGRAEVEFENGAMAFIGANTVVEFYDLSLNDGAHVTRLVLRQGTGIFYVHPANGDYFSVTGGDFTVEANGRTRFRLDNYDDGSTVNVEQGYVEVVHKKATKSLEKGQSLAVHVTDPDNLVVARASESDDFDKWVSGRIDSVATATNYSNQYVSTANYASGFADLYTYGSWFNMGGYGYGWRPFGAGLGWCPFDSGSWYMDPSIGGWGFLSSAPWGWLPYHYGGWIFSPVYGWTWLPSGFGGGPIYYRPVTAVWVHSGPTIGIVPLHPGDKNGKLPQNLSQGVFAVESQTLAKTPMSPGNEKWSVVKNAPSTALVSGSLAASSAPARVSRTILSGSAGSRPVTLSRESSIVYDPAGHRFVNANSSAVAGRETTKTEPNATMPGKVPIAGAPAVPTARTGQPPAARQSMPSRASFATPAPARTSGSSGGSAVWSGIHGSSSGGSMGSVHGSSASSGSSHASGGASHH